MRNFIKKYQQSAITIVIIILMICVYQLFCFVSDVSDLHLYTGWQEVKVNKSLSIKVPSNWEKNEKCGLLYFSDPDIKDDNNIVLFQSETSDCFQIGDSIKINSNMSEKNICSDNFLSIVSLSSSVNSLGTISGEAIISADDTTHRENYIIFSDNTNDYLFYSWDRKVDDKTLDKIADSVKYTAE